MPRQAVQLETTSDICSLHLHEASGYHFSLKLRLSARKQIDVTPDFSHSYQEAWNPGANLESCNN